MRNCFLWLSFAILVLYSSSTASSWNQVASHISDEIRLSRQKVADKLRRIREERKRFKDELASLKREVKDLESKVSVDKAKLEDLKRHEKELREQLLGEEAEVQRIQMQLHSWACDVKELFGRNPTSIRYPQLGKVVATLSDPRHFVSFEEMGALVELLLEEIERGGSIESWKGKVIDRRGIERMTTILRVGTFDLFAIGNRGVQVLRVSENYKPIITPIKLSWSQSRLVRKYLRGNQNRLPFDIWGEIPYRRTASRGAVRWFEAGGVFMWPLLLIALFAAFISIERLVYLRNQRHIDETLWNRLVELLVDEGKWQKCIEFCSSFNQSPVCRIVSRVLDSGQKLSINVLEEKIYECLTKETENLERFLPTLSMLGAIAPLLGLLGTVSGIIKTFQVITVVGTGNPRYLSGGISEALITTQFGLMIAVPIVIIHHLLERKVEALTMEMEEKSSALYTHLSDRIRHDS